MDWNADGVFPTDGRTGKNCTGDWVGRGPQIRRDVVNVEVVVAAVIVVAVSAAVVVVAVSAVVVVGVFVDMTRALADA